MLLHIPSKGCLRMLHPWFYGMRWSKASTIRQAAARFMNFGVYDF
ncbi:hypothetical protein [Polynucleobacter hirudinilacicola]|nr:hypothetical protein [Polynucleobacter hirudinilacicola]